MIAKDEMGNYVLVTHVKACAIRNTSKPESFQSP
jgi:hypothetical protein